MTDISSFSWFDLSKYDAVEALNINGWYFQLEARQVIYTCCKYLKTPGLISMSTMDLLNAEAESNIASIKEDPLLIKENKPGSYPSVQDADYLSLWSAFSATAHCRLVTQRPRQDEQTAVARQYEY